MEATKVLLRTDVIEDSTFTHENVREIAQKHNVEIVARTDQGGSGEYPEYLFAAPDKEIAKKFLEELFGYEVGEIVDLSEYYDKPKLSNRSMARKLESGECLDVRKEGRPATGEDAEKEDGDYIGTVIVGQPTVFVLSRFVDGKDYCDAESESWIWSIGKSKKTGVIFASTDTRFYQNDDFESLFLR